MSCRWRHHRVSVIRPEDYEVLCAVETDEGVIMLYRRWSKLWQRWVYSYRPRGERQHRHLSLHNIGKPGTLPVGKKNSWGALHFDVGNPVFLVTEFATDMPPIPDGFDWFGTVDFNVGESVVAYCYEDERGITRTPWTEWAKFDRNAKQRPIHVLDFHVGLPETDDAAYALGT